jgi:hypothetical protein
MTFQITNLDGVVGFAIGCVVVSSLSALVFLAFGHFASVREPSGSLGFMSSLLGSGVAFWFSLRTRDRRFIATGLISLLPFAFWCWAIYQVVHGRYA